MKDMDGRIKGEHDFCLGMMSFATLPLALKVCACVYLCVYVCMYVCLHMHTCTDSPMCAVKITSIHGLLTYLTAYTGPKVSPLIQ